jgi:hypothetical protein
MTLTENIAAAIQLMWQKAAATPTREANIPTRYSSISRIDDFSLLMSLFFLLLKLTRILHAKIGIAKAKAYAEVKAAGSSLSNDKKTCKITTPIAISPPDHMLD